MGSLLLASTSGAALALLVGHLVANRGPRRAGALLALAVAYGLARGALVRGISEGALGGNAPYSLPAGGPAVGGIPLQEVAGWILGALLAAHLGAGLARRFGASPRPATVALFGAPVFATLSLAVESTAARAGWWTWSLPPSPPLPVPAIALVDWGFVAFDLLLPLLVLSSSGFGRRFLLACLPFPVHFASHLVPGSIAPFLPVSVFDLVHVGLPLALLLVATREPAMPNNVEPAPERLRPLPVAAVAVILAVTAFAAPQGAAGFLWSSPLLLLAVVALAPTEVSLPAIPRGTLRAGAMLAAFFLLVVVLVPRQIRRRGYEDRMRAAAARIAAGDLAAAEELARGAIALRPDRAAPRTLLALVRLGQSDRAGARRELDEALRREPGSLDAMRLRATIELADGNRDDARPFAVRGRRARPSDWEWIYLDEFATGTAGPGRPPSAPALDRAREGGAAALRSLSALARSLRDEATAAECDRLLAGGR